MSRFLYPFMMMFGFYIIIYGDLSPGGGFQGGAILGTAYIASYLAKGEKTFDLHQLIHSEKFLFMMILIVSSISLFTRGILFTNFMPHSYPIGYNRVFLILLNILIGFKVAMGLTAIFSIFIEEDN